MSRPNLPPPVATCLFVLILALSPASRHAEAARVHLIAVGDTLDKKIGDEVNEDIQHLTGFLVRSGRKSLLPPKMLIGPECNPKAIAKALDQIDIQPNDAIVFYYTGHGAYDATNGQFMEIPRLGENRYVSRTAIRDKLKGLVDARQIRLAVLMTDMCNLQKIINVPPWPMPGVGAAAGIPADDDDPIFKALFVESVGFVDVTSASANEGAAIYPKFVSVNNQMADGSIFSTVVTDFMAANYNQRFSWRYF